MMIFQTPEGGGVLQKRFYQRSQGCTYAVSVDGYCVENWRHGRHAYTPIAVYKAAAVEYGWKP